MRNHLPVWLSLKKGGKTPSIRSGSMSLVRTCEKGHVNEGTRWGGVQAVLSWIFLEIPQFQVRQLRALCHFVPIRPSKSHPIFVVPWASQCRVASSRVSQPGTYDVFYKNCNWFDSSSRYAIFSVSHGLIYHFFQPRWQQTIGKPWENHRKTIGKWRFTLW